MKCLACRRELTSEVSKKYGYGTSCLKRAVAEGNAPLESLSEIKQLRREAKKRPKQTQQPIPERCDKTMDLFASAKKSAIKLLECAVKECEAYGLVVTYRIENES
jgi:hypothetical protein